MKNPDRNLGFSDTRLQMFATASTVVSDGLRDGLYSTTPQVSKSRKHIAALERVKQDDSDQRSRPAHQKAGNRTERNEDHSRYRFAAIKRGSLVLLNEHLKGSCFKTSKGRPTEQGHSRS